jgi:hypothetical protein
MKPPRWKRRSARGTSDELGRLEVRPMSCPRKRASRFSRNASGHARRLWTRFRGGDTKQSFLTNAPLRDSALPTLRLLTCGSVDDGKSTLIGRMLYEKKLIFDDQLSTLERDSKKFGTTGRRSSSMRRSRRRSPAIPRACTSQRWPARSRTSPASTRPTKPPRRRSSFSIPRASRPMRSLTAS